MSGSASVKRSCLSRQEMWLGGSLANAAPSNCSWPTAQIEPGLPELPASDQSILTSCGEGSTQLRGKQCTILIEGGSSVRVVTMPSGT